MNRIFLFVVLNIQYNLILFEIIYTNHDLLHQFDTIFFLCFKIRRMLRKYFSTGDAQSPRSQRHKPYPRLDSVQDVLDIFPVYDGVGVDFNYVCPMSIVQ